MTGHHSSNWKSVERKVAKKLGGARIPLSGRNNMGKIGDVELVGYDVEVKSGKQVPVTVSRWLDTLRGTQSQLGKDSQIPLLVMQPFQKKEMIVVMMLTDFAKLAEAARGGTYTMD